MPPKSQQGRAPQPPQAVVAREFVSGRPTAVITANDVIAAPTSASSRGSGGRGGGTLTRLAADAFLPDGYPESVSSDYLSYQLWDSIQGLSSYVRGMLSSHAMLAGLGVGSAAATPLGAVFQFFVKDLAGMVGGIAFASSQGRGFDCYAKQWRLFADVMNDAGMALELASPLLPGAFLLLACLGSVARAVTGVAGGATRMALTQHFARQRNAADIAAKEGSQETAVTLVGMLLGMALIRLAQGRPMLTWAAFWALTALHVHANVVAMRSLRITGINQARLGLLLRHYLCTDKALTPAQLAAQESLVPPPLQRLLRLLGLGGLDAAGGPLVAVAPQLCSLSVLLQCQVASQLQQAAQHDSRQQYLAVAAAGEAAAGRRGPHAVVVLRQGATSADVMQAYCAALMLAYRAQQGHGGGRKPSSIWTSGAQLALADVDAWLAGGKKEDGTGGKEAVNAGKGSCTSSGYGSFLASLEAAGWALDRVALMQGQSRLAWGTTELHAE